MWQQLFDYTRQLFALKNQTEKNSEDMKELQKQVRELSVTLQQVINLVYRNHESERHERELLALRMENILLRADRSLPSGEKQVNDDAEELRTQVAALKKENEELLRLLEDTKT